ncbi:hypothetical protein [Hydrocarboniphaga sp.]|uniref:hypothetical protein n=1 Tax=Hydrocarboniphaga sp. TaxID=2033016 RepID=UPI002607027C|nr:hypothetical protein [Hydrocarboniphaga sp.]
MPAEPETPWAHLAAPTAERVVARAAEFLGGVREFEIGRSFESSHDLARRFNVTAGCLWHVDLSLSRLGPMRPARGLSGYRTPVPDFYLGGAGSHPTPGLCGLPGRLASSEILRRIRAGL